MTSQVKLTFRNRYHNSRTTFLSLPQEIKSKIYKLVLGGHLIHMKGSHSDFDHSILSRKYECSPPGSFKYPDDRLPPFRSYHDTGTRINIALFFVCTRTYHDVYSIFWSRNTFVFNIFGSGHHIRNFIQSNKLEALRMLDLELLFHESKDTERDLKNTIKLIVGRMKSQEKVRIAICEPDWGRSIGTILPSVIDSLEPLAKISLKELMVVMRDKAFEKFAQEQLKSMQEQTG